MLLNDEDLARKVGEASDVLSQVEERLEILRNEARIAKRDASEYVEQLEELDRDRHKLIQDLETMIELLLTADVSVDHLRDSLVSPYAQKALARTAF